MTDPNTGQDNKASPPPAQNAAQGTAGPRSGEEAPPAFYLESGGGPALPPNLGEEFVAGSARTQGTAPADTQAIENALREIFDPEIPVNIYDLGLIYDIRPDGDEGTEIVMTLTAPGCPVAGTLPQEVAECAARVDGSGRVRVRLTWDPPWDWTRMSDDARTALGFVD